MNLETGMYFGGEEEGEESSFSEEQFAESIKDKSDQDLDDLEIELKDRIDIEKDNEFKKKQAPLQGIPEEALPLEVKDAERLHQIDEKKLEILKILKKEKSKKTKKGPSLGSFFGF